MVLIKRERFPDPLLYCPECQLPMIYLGTIYDEDSRNMVRCLGEECGNTIPPEQALKIGDTAEGGLLFRVGFGRGYEACETQDLEEMECLEDI